jgi:ankyrin repeat protein
MTLVFMNRTDARFRVFDAIKKLLSGRKAEKRRVRHMVDTCCAVRNGELHELFCTKERCPFCGTQLITCDCIRSALNLSDDERLILDEYIDDSVPPLSDIMQRWKDALVRKGRVPFKAFPDDPIRAAYRGDVEAMLRFLDDGFPPNEGNEVGYTALMGAARGESADMIRLLLSRGAQAGLADKRGCTALHWAVAQSVGDPARQVACVRTLIEAGADPNARNEADVTPLMNAAWFGCCDSVRELLRCGADPRASNLKGKSAKDCASERGHKAVEELLK